MTKKYKAKHQTLVEKGLKLLKLRFFFHNFFNNASDLNFLELKNYL